VKPAQTLIKAAQSQTDECILWPHAIDRCGYGACAFLGQNISAHRAVLILYSGLPRSADLQAAHDVSVCRSRSCVNPRHLRWATCFENRQDAEITLLRRRYEGIGHCLQCGTEFVGRAKRIEEGKTKFCSRSCRSSYNNIARARRARTTSRKEAQ
jgi:hypothetical protein